MIQEFLFWVLLKENQNTNSEGYTHSSVHCSIIYNRQDMEAT